MLGSKLLYASKRGPWGLIGNTGLATNMQQVIFWTHDYHMSDTSGLFY